MYEQGDYVVYHHDVCKITGYAEKYIDDDDYLILEALYEHALTFYVPVRSLDILLHPVLTENEALDLIDSIATTEPLDESKLSTTLPKKSTPGQGSASTNNKLRDSYRHYVKDSSVRELVPFIKLIHGRIEERLENNQSPIATDKEYYEQVEKIIDDELAAALKMDRDQIEPFIENRTGIKIYRIHERMKEHEG